MGCGISKFNLMEADGMSCGLKRRIVESRSKNNLLDNNDPSTAPTAKLLKGGGEFAIGESRKASFELVVIKEPPLQPQIQKKEGVDKEKGEWGLRQTKKDEHNEVGNVDDEYEKGENDNDLGRRISDFDGNWIGSPSFREYCVDSEESDDQDVVNHDKGSVEDTKKKTQGANNSVCVHPESEPKRLDKKGSRGRKFKNAISTMHKPKNLWQVTTFYNRNNHQIPSEKLPEKEI